MNNGHFLEAKNIFKVYGKKEIIRGVNFSVRTGEIIGLLGPNGAGKTTIFYTIVGLKPPDRGEILLDNVDIKNLPMYMRARMGICYLPQEPSIFRNLTVRENIKSILELKYSYTDTKNKKKFQNGIDEKTDNILNEFRLAEFADRTSERLSGGERRRTEIARAVALNPIFMLFDEPFAGIDPISIIELKKIFFYLKDKGLGIIITDHNVRDTLSITDRAYIIHNGIVLAEGTPADLVNDQKVLESYLGREFKL